MKKFVVLALILAGVVLFQFASDFENAFSEPPPAVEEPLPEKAFVYVTGAVKNPGLYALETGKTAGEAVEAAGGMIAYADTGAVNLADRAEDGAHIHVPYDFQGIPENPAEAGKVSLNRADEKAQLWRLISSLIARNTALLAVSKNYRRSKALVRRSSPS